jgi:outer membrane protein, protease secretion system
MTRTIAGLPAPKARAGRIALACAAVASAVLAAHPVHAQLPQTAAAPKAAPEIAGAPLTLSQAYHAALEQDATIRATRAATDAKRERLPQARAQLLPNVSASAGVNNNHLLARVPSNTSSSGTVLNDLTYSSSNRVLSIRQPIFRPYQFADYRQAEAQVADANAALDKETQNVAVRVATAYLEALLAEDQVALAGAQKASFTTQLDAARKRFKAGVGVRTDVDDAQAKLDQAIAQELQARQNVGYTRRELQVLVNAPVGKLATLDAARLQLLEPNPNRLEDWVERAELTSPEVRSLQAQRDAARADIDKAKAGHLPTLDAVAQWSVARSDTVTTINSRYDTRAIGLQLNVPIFAGGYTSSQVRQSIAALESAEQQLEALRRDLALRVEKQFRGVTEGVAQIRALEQAVRSAETTLESNRKSYEGGVRTLVDVLNAEQQRVSAMRDLAQARYVYVLSRIQLQALTGEPNDPVIEEANSWLKP